MSLEERAPLALIIDDEPDIRELLTVILTSDGWDVLTAGTGRAGIELARETAPDVIVSDVRLPDIDGLGLIRELEVAEGTTDIPVILVTGLADEACVVAGFDAGAHDYITKPFAPAQLRARCRSALRVRRDQLRLIASQHELRLLAVHATDVVQRMGIDGTIRYVSPSVTRLLGWRPDELVGKPAADFCHPDDQPVTDAVLAAGDGQLVTSQRRLRRADGGHVWIESTAQLIPGPTGEAEILSSARDITALRNEQAALAATEAMQRTSLDSLEQGVALTDIDGQVKLLNRAGARLLGYSAEQLTELFQTGRWEVYREDGTVLPPDDRPIRHTLNTGEAVAAKVVRWRRSNGDLITLRVTTEPVHDADGTMTGLVIAFADITAERVAEQAHRAVTDRLAWQASHDALTGLPSRAMLLDHLDRRLNDATAAPTALLFIDLDNFKDVNDTLGHNAGDELLSVVAERLERALRADDLVARYGGDEFIAVLSTTSDHDARAVADRVLAALAAPVQLTRGNVSISASIGLVHATTNDRDALIRAADAAMFQAKNAGRNRITASP